MRPRSTYKVITDSVRAIRALRERRGLSVNKAAPLIGTNKSTLTALENGRIDLSDDWIDKILKGYKFNRADFKEMKEAKSSLKEELINEIICLLDNLKHDKLITIKQLLLNLQ